MKYMILTVFVLLVCFGLGYLLSKLLIRKEAGKLKRFAASFLFGIGLMIVVTLIYFCIYYHADDNIEEYMQGNEIVRVSDVDGGYFFDGPGNDAAVVFYQGGKVDCRAYAPLMYKLAENGFDCFLADIPFRFSLFNSNAADSFISTYDYDKWILAGHSLGGVTAASYASDNVEKVDGIVLLASYPSIDIDDSISLISIYGDKDGCLDKEEYEDSKVNWPVNSYEFIISGGNHSQYGNYGFQKGDGDADIDNDRQQDITVKAFLEFFRN